MGGQSGFWDIEERYARLSEAGTSPTPIGQLFY